MKSQMSEALKKKRLGGIDLTIIVGNGEDESLEKEQKESGLAPEGSHPNQDSPMLENGDGAPRSMASLGMHEDEDQDKALIGKMMREFGFKGGMAGKEKPKKGE